ncbi:TetR/AcrR family transcriptional regulator [Mycolicibacterium sediminis]|uniref:TetR/AcrR family transcriptional regulator n=1 Tax=Mycolicibacterium sediminis TaxID=1286180 RepID=UPI0039089ED7
MLVARSGAAEPVEPTVEEESRATRFMRSALAILGETGRADFTVLQVVERSKTSLRSFYQHFASKDELLLALIEKIMAESTLRWRTETEPLAAPDALRTLIDRICAPASSTTQDSINRGLTFYNDHLAETVPAEYARVLSPVNVLIGEIIDRGIAEGAFAADLDVASAATLIMQSTMGAMRLRVLGAELNGAPLEGRHIYDFCIRALSA